METRLVKINNMEDCKKDMEEAGELIKAGELVAFPTETVYGLGGNGLLPDAAKKIYAAKGRPSDNPLILHVCDMQMVESLVKALLPVYKRFQTMQDVRWNISGRDL